MRIPPLINRRLFYFITYGALFIVFLSIFLIIVVIPPVWKIPQKQTISVTQYTKKRGKEEKNIGPADKTWINYDDISRNLIGAVIVAEDSRFMQHKGIDLEEMEKSFNLNIEKQRFVRGASTITQQLVKIAFLSREKTLLRKFRDISGALLLEQISDKKTILEWYLNLVEFGDGIYGARKACAHYFQTKPEQLSIAQAIHLALVLPSPNAWSFGLRRKNLTSFGHKRFSQIAHNMKRQGFITEAQLQSTLASGNFGSPIDGYQPPKQESAPEQLIIPPPIINSILDEAVIIPGPEEGGSSEPQGDPTW